MFAGMAVFRPGPVASRPLLDTALDASSIRLQFHGGEEVRITDRGDLAALKERLRFEPKSECLCLNVDRIVFEAPSDTAWAAISDHCFDYHVGGRVTRLRMNRELAERLTTFAPAASADGVRARLLRL
jgi:hypothetical protein